MWHRMLPVNMHYKWNVYRKPRVQFTGTAYFSLHFRRSRDTSVDCTRAWLFHYIESIGYLIYCYAGLELLTERSAEHNLRISWNYVTGSLFQLRLLSLLEANMQPTISDYYMIYSICPYVIISCSSIEFLPQLWNARIFSQFNNAVLEPANNRPLFSESTK